MTPTAVSWRPMTTEGGLCIIRRPQVAVKWTKTRKPTTVTAENATQSSSSADRDRVTMRNRTLPDHASVRPDPRRSASWRLCRKPLVALEYVSSHRRRPKSRRQRVRPPTL